METSSSETDCRILNDHCLPIDIKDCKATNVNGIHSHQIKTPILPNDYEFRELSEEDFDQGFLELLEQLTQTLPITRQQFLDRLHQMQCQQPRCYHIFVIRKLRFLFIFQQI